MNVGVCVCVCGCSKNGGVVTSLSVLLLSDEGKALLADPHSLRDYRRSQAAPGLRGAGSGVVYGGTMRG